MANQPEVFPAAFRAKRAISRRAYLQFGVGAAMMGVTGILIAIAFAVTSTPNFPLIVFGGAAFTVGLILLANAIINLSRLQQPIQVEVDQHRLIWREGSRSATLEFAEVERVVMVKDYKPVSEDFTLAYPVVRFIENDGEMMEFEVSFEDRGYTHHGRFDALSITRSVLRVLQGRNVDIAPPVQEYIRSGIVDIDALPER